MNVNIHRGGATPTCAETSTSLACCEVHLERSVRISALLELRQALMALALRAPLTVFKHHSQIKGKGKQDKIH